MHCPGQGISFQNHHPQAQLPTIARRQTVSTDVGGVPVGSAHPIVVQSMTNTDTADAAGTVLQVAALAAAGSRLVRITVNNEEAARAVPQIAARRVDMGVQMPITADYYYNS